MVRMEGDTLALSSLEIVATPIPDLAEVRRKEMAAAAEVLGAELLRGEFGDGELIDAPDQRRVLVELYRRFGPTLVLAHSAADLLE